jgi:hypothetical protein
MVMIQNDAKKILGRSLSMSALYVFLVIKTLIY